MELERIKISITSRSPDFKVLENSISQGCKTYIIRKNKCHLSNIYVLNVLMTFKILYNTIFSALLFFEIAMMWKFDSEQTKRSSCPG